MLDVVELPEYVVVTVPASTEQQNGAVKLNGEIIGAFTPENTAVIEQLRPSPIDAGSVQFIGLMKGAFIVVVPPHEFVIVSDPEVGKQELVKVPEST
jgi:hypothetical protein